MRSSVGRVLGTGLFALAVTAGLGGCATPTGTEAAASGGYRLVVQRDGRVLDELDLARLRDLPQTEIATPQSHGNPVQRGPAVRAVLEAAGAADVHRVRFEGRDPAQTLTAAELTDRVVLSFTKRDTVKLAGADLGRDRWVRDVRTVVVDP
ncbi:hypothetical protein MU0083_000226 [[Mycobacterium] kokjensenii]|uniref:Uncharacterized protein n=2 Tax=[Mycobacterium] kokjensenii TaxID=3064287 RepID=A0ABN9MQT8_9MYCO|nr:hypothetical protein [Mycolicibacter sp. MU0083]CAJ1493257.1 hypothetical protein MU0083_000226 [Mycolicibacter sp. MU0083]